ncbi:hypothetical protein SCALM49S_02063 [Streptomyces californicus]
MSMGTVRSRPGTVISSGVGLRGNGTAGISASSYPRSGTSLVSSPRSVPRAVIPTVGSCLRRASARASAGSMCPAVPPPASTTCTEIHRSPDERFLTRRLIVFHLTPGFRMARAVFAAGSSRAKAIMSPTANIVGSRADPP